MTMHITKTWIEDGKLITELIPQEAVYKREWVGLTDKEREEATGWSVEHIEAKLKEKNT